MHKYGQIIESLEFFENWVSSCCGPDGAWLAGVSYYSLSSSSTLGSFSIPLAIGDAAVEDGHVDGVLCHDGLANGVCDDGAGARGEVALGGVVHLAVEGGGAEDGGQLVHRALQLAVVSSDGFEPPTATGTVA